MNEYGIKITLPTREDLLELKSYDGAYAPQTDMVIVTGGAFIQNEWHVEPDSAMTMTKTIVDGEPYINGIERRGWLRTRTNDMFSIRPILELPDAIFDDVIKNKITEVGADGKYRDVVYFGEYPQMAPGRVMQSILKHNFTDVFEKLRDPKKRRKINVYCMPLCIEHGHAEIPITYRGKNYVCVEAYLNPDNKRPLITKIKKHGFRIYKRCPVFIEIEPVKWLIDYKNKRLIAVKNLLSGIKFDENKKNDCTYENSHIKKYLEKYMLKSLLFCETERLDELNKPKVLLECISGYMKYYLGRDSLSSRISGLIWDYNDNLKRLSQNYNTGSELKLGYKDENTLQNEFVGNLESIYNELQSDEKIVGPYINMIDILAGYKTKDELSEYITGVKTLITNNPLITDEKVTLLEEFCLIIENNIHKMNEYVDECKKTRQNTPNKTLEDLKRDFRSEIHPFVQKLCELVEKRDLVKEITDGTNAIIRDTFTFSHNARAQFLLEMISEVVRTVKSRGNEDDLIALKNTITIDIDYSKSILEILKELNEKVIKAYKIELDIKDRKGYERKCESLMMPVDAMSYLDGQKLTQKL